MQFYACVCARAYVRARVRARVHQIKNGIHFPHFNYTKLPPNSINSKLAKHCRVEVTGVDNVRHSHGNTGVRIKDTRRYHLLGTEKPVEMVVNSKIDTVELIYQSVNRVVDNWNHPLKEIILVSTINTFKARSRTDTGQDGGIYIMSDVNNQ